MTSPVRSSPLFIPLATALVLIFLALVIAGWFGQLSYLVGAGILMAVAARTWSTFDTPSNWAAASAVLGLASASIFAATELSDATAAGGGGGAIIPVAWLFAITSWYAHFQRVKTLRWVITLVQVSFTSLSGLLFIVVSSQADDALRMIGYGVAGLTGALAGALAVTGILGRIRVELAKRNP